MAFLNIFFKTLGFLIGITTFLILINIFLFLAPNDNGRFKFIEGDRESNNVIATLELSGPIINNLDNSLIGNIVEFIDPDLVREYLIGLEKLNPKVLIIKINSPGGTVAASATLEKIISNFKKQTEAEIYFHSNEILASGGYWVATSGDKIFANYGSIIGSIGVSGPSWYYYDEPTSISAGIFGQKIETRKGIKIFDQNAGNSKDLYNPFRKPTQSELIHLQNIVKKIYNDFINKVSKSRKIEINVLKNEIGALIYTGNQAKEKFLIDGVLDYNELIKKIIKLKKFEDYKILDMKVNDNFINKYLSNYFKINNSFVCNKLNINFVSVLPLFINNC